MEKITQYSFKTLLTSFFSLMLSILFLPSVFAFAKPELHPIIASAIQIPNMPDNQGCTTAEQKELRTSDFGFEDGVQDGSLSASNVDLSSKWNLPQGSIIVSVQGASSKSTLQLFEVNKNLPATFSFSGTVPVRVVAEHSARVDAGQRDGIRALDNVAYLQTSDLPNGIVAGDIDSNYYVENITNSAITGRRRFGLGVSRFCD